MSAVARIEGVERGCRSLFISDVHLGSGHCHASELADMLARIPHRQLFLVGDIVDLWWMSSRRAVWDSGASRLVECLHELARGGVELTYIPGNHDRPIRRFVGLGLPQMQIRRRVIHETADGRRLLVTHGDEFDAVTRMGGWQEWLGDRLYDRILAGNRMANQLRARLGMRYWSLADFVKRQSGAAERYIARFADAGIDAVRRRGLDGIICGHIHRAELRLVDGLIYANDGDWVESLTALAERPDGSLELLHAGAGIEYLSRLPARQRPAPTPGRLAAAA